jgi:hypothetical protein
VTQSINVTLAVSSNPPLAGIRISGRIPGDTKRSIYISGNPGTIFSDGTFEFVGVLPGRQNIVTLDNPGATRSLGATLVVGDRDLPDVELEELSVAPANSDKPQKPLSVSGRPAGLRVKTFSIHGRVSDEDTHEPFNAGKIVVNENHGYPFSLNDDGTFDIPKLLPGSYVVDAVVFGIGNISRTIVLDEADSTIDLTLAPKPGE